MKIRTLLQGALCAPASLLCLGTSAFAGTATYQIDFGPANSPLADGFEAGELPTLEPVGDPGFTVSPVGGGKSIEIAFKGEVSGFGLGDESKPLTTDGIFTVKSTTDEPKNIPFSISGLPPGAKVKFSAIEAWNGKGRAAYISLGDSGMIDLAGTEPEADPPVPPEFVVVAEGLTVPANGTLEGVFSNSDGEKMRAEGQCGAFVIVVDTP
jgi:hypothetical protein